MFETVVMVGDVNSLVRTADKLRPDLAIVDLSLRSSEEANIARRLKRRNPRLKVIIVSLHDEASVANEVLSSGAEGFVLRQSAGTVLLLAVQEILQGRRFVSPAALIEPDAIRSA